MSDSLIAASFRSRQPCDKKKTNAIDLQGREMQMAIVKSEFKRVQAFIVALIIGLMLMTFNFFILKGNTAFLSEIGQDM